MLRLTLALSFLSVFAVSCRESSAVPADPHLRHAEELLARYVAIDTSGISQGYRAAANLLASELRAAGIEPQVLTPGGADFPIVYARLKAAEPKQGALILMHHMDVVGVDASQWSVPPYSARRANGYLWGRGAIDDKSLGIAHLEAFLDLHRTAAPLVRDVVFLAVPDEEKGGRHGAAALVRERSDLFSGRDVVLTEGGSTDTKVDTVSIWSIDVAQKVPLWVRVTTRGSGGHGATSSHSASQVLMEILADLQEELPLRHEMEEEVARMIASRARAYGGSKRRLMSQPHQSWRAGTLFDAVGSGESAVLRDTMIVTTLRAGTAVNVVPSNAYAEIDLRLLRSTDIAATIQHMRTIVGDRGSVDVLLQGEAAPSSPIEHPLYQILERELPLAEAGSIVVPSVSPATTDARYFRRAGIASYGFSPFKVNFYDADGIHGTDERIRISFFHDGVRVMRRVVRAYCVAE